MSYELSKAEVSAEQATTLPAFNAININNVRDGVSELLSTIGRNGFFNEYTDHSMKHVQSMLQMLDWILVEETQKAMSKADWLTLVLGIYFHDLGMVVTNDEYDQRSQSEFDEFCQTQLFVGSDGIDYKDKIEKFGKDDADKFFYQEFVREHHATRVKRWILGDKSKDLGVCDQLVDEVQKLIGAFPDFYLRDVAMLCESHHADDLDEISTNTPYGSTEDETANPHFLAIVLRVVDLLQVTNQRTPAILYRTINPRNPVSQIEWKKQGEVRTVRPEPLTVGSEKKVPDTIEIHATFTESAGYFGLTDYVEYARGELAKCNHWLQKSLPNYTSSMQFPWKRIDETKIEADGFLKENFRFELDNEKILNLLTGHTLYNDTSVVVRELAQNAIDAVRLQHDSDAEAEGRVELNWTSDAKVFSVTDNGTGMTQSEIENNLLKVGASRYQDPTFKKENPDFSSISRFGIGILSAFMVADEVKITTVSRGEEKARRLTLQSVHGNYLIELLDKNSDDVPSRITSHGTHIELKVRSSAKFEKVDNVASRFIYFPRCRVTCSVDGIQSDIGFKNTNDAAERLRDSLSSTNSQIAWRSRIKLKVITYTFDGINVSFLVQKWPYSDTWKLVFAEPKPVPISDSTGFTPGVAIEGIFVRGGLPGFSGEVPMCIVNATGSKSPHANVARNDFEINDHYLNLVSSVFSAFAKHVEAEFDSICETRSRSLTHASNEATFMISRLLSCDFKTSKERRFASDPLLDLKVLAVETAGERKTISFKDVRALSEIRIVECPFFSAAEAAIAELASHSSISEVVRALGADDMQIDPECTYIVGGLQASAQKIALDGWQIKDIIFQPDKKRVDAVWAPSDVSMWYSYTDKDNQRYGKVFQRTASRLQHHGFGRFVVRDIYIATDRVNVECPDDANYGLAIVGGETLVLPGSGINQHLIEMFEAIRASEVPELASYLFGVVLVLDAIAQIRKVGEHEDIAHRAGAFGRVITGPRDEREKFLRSILGIEQGSPPSPGIPIDTLLEAIAEDTLDVFEATRQTYSYSRFEF